MMDKAKIAAIAGALAFLAAEAPRTSLAASAVTPAHSGSSPWALYGRQSQMNLRTMVQRRTQRMR